MKYWENCLKQIETEEQKIVNEFIDKFKSTECLKEFEIKIGDKVVNDIVLWAHIGYNIIRSHKIIEVRPGDFVYLNNIKCFIVYQVCSWSCGKQHIYIKPYSPQIT